MIVNYKPQITARPGGKNVFQRTRPAPLTAEERADFEELGIAKPPVPAAPAPIDSTVALAAAVAKLTAVTATQGAQLEALFRLGFLQTLVQNPMPMTSVAATRDLGALLTSANYVELYRNERNSLGAVRVVAEFLNGQGGFQVYLSLSTDNSHEQLVTALGQSALPPAFGNLDSGPIILMPHQSLYIAPVDFVNFPPSVNPAAPDKVRIRAWAPDTFLANAAFPTR